MLNKEAFKILIIDDNPNIYKDFNKILSRLHRTTKFPELKYKLFEDQQKIESTLPHFEVYSALQGKEGVMLIEQALQEKQPYALAFVDIRMPPGWDGIETIKHIWEIDENIQIVICTAYSDYSWEETVSQLGHTHNLLILKKPFDKEEVCQLAHALTKKWHLNQQIKIYLNYLEEINKEKEAALTLSLSECNKLQVKAILSDKLATIGILTAGIIHEINNPLTWILGNLEFMKNQVGLIKQKNEKSDLMNEFEVMINQVIDGAKKIVDIIKNIKGFARQDALPEWADIHELINSAIAISIPQFKYQTKLEKHFSTETIPLLLLNKGRMGQVLLNLIINAAQSFTYNDVKKNLIQISTSIVKNQVCIQIQDNGSGIPPEILPKIFDPFFTTKPVGIGTGLGLSICKDLMNEMKGEISVESRIGKGTTFSLYIPLM